MFGQETDSDVCQETNSDVIRLPGRSYPGVLIQGDSLMVLVGSAQDAIELFEKDKEEAMAALTHLYEELKWRLEYYQEVLDENGTPFST